MDVHITNEQYRDDVDCSVDVVSPIRILTFLTNIVNLYWVFVLVEMETANFMV